MEEEIKKFIRENNSPTLELLKLLSKKFGKQPHTYLDIINEVKKERNYV